MYKNRYSNLGAGSSAQSLDCSGANTTSFPCPIGLNVEWLYGTIKTTISSSAPAVVTVYYRPNVDSATNQVVLGTLSLPAGAVIPSIYYKPTADNVCYAGGQIAFVVTTAATVAGSIYCGFEGGEAPEVPANIPNSVASL